MPVCYSTKINNFDVSMFYRKFTHTKIWMSNDNKCLQQLKKYSAISMHFSSFY